MVCRWRKLSPALSLAAAGCSDPPGRHTENRNPAGALFVVDGEGRRIPQDDDADFATDVWGTKELAGDVAVILDSTQEDESDSVIWVRLVPR